MVSKIIGAILLLGALALAIVAVVFGIQLFLACLKVWFEGVGSYEVALHYFVVAVSCSLSSKVAVAIAKPLLAIE